MPAYLDPYLPALWSLTALVLLFLVQLGVADIGRIRARVTPGRPVEGDHGSFAFRADRAHGNTVENLAAFVLVALLAIVTAAEPDQVNALAVAFAAARFGHMLFYYLDLRLLRSVSFGIGALATLLMALVVCRQLLAS